MFSRHLTSFIRFHDFVTSTPIQIRYILKDLGFDLKRSDNLSCRTIFFYHDLGDVSLGIL